MKLALESLNRKKRPFKKGFFKRSTPLLITKKALDDDY
jgi:hypothetical protein